MNLYYYRSKDANNFGDELNLLIYKNLLPDFFNEKKYPDIDFYGIGTIIDTRISQDKKSIIFGSGIRDIVNKYNIKNWDIRFVRGYITSNILGLRGEKVITDSAYSILLLPEFLPINETKKFKISLVPHFRVMNNLPWKMICNLLQINLIDPRDAPIEVIKNICQSEKIIAGALHGAIMADVCRVPWHRLKMEILNSESLFLNDLKWLDWLSSISKRDIYTYVKHTIKHQNVFYLKRYLITYFELIHKLKRAINSKHYQITSNKKIEEIKDKIQSEIDKLKNDYK